MENRVLDKKVYNCKVDYRRNFSAISLTVLAVILAVQLIFFLTEIVLSFKSYNPAAGISGSSWVGFQNFSKIFISSNFRSVIQNTISFNLLFAVMVFVIAFIAGRIITAIPQNNIVRDMLAILCILPLFLPAEVYANWFITAMGSRTFINPDAMRFIHPLLSALKYMGIPIITINILDDFMNKKTL